jgi:LysM repeat protein
MKPALKKTFSAILIALASLVIVIGIASLAMVQDGTSILRGQDDASATPTLVSTSQGSGGLSGSTDSTNPTDSAGLEGSVTPSLTDQTVTPSGALVCDTPEGWMPIIVMPNQTIEQLAALYKTTAEMLQQGNCLAVKKVEAGTIIFIPASATQGNQSSVQCGPPAGWVIYYVQSGDTLFGIATMTGTTVNQLMVANCLKSTYVYTGQRLYTPPYYVYPLQPVLIPTPWITIPDLLTPEVPYLPTGIPFPPP